MVSAGNIVSNDFYLARAQKALTTKQLYVDHSVTDISFLMQLADNQEFAIPQTKYRSGDLSVCSGLGVTAHAVHTYLYQNWPKSVPPANRVEFHRYTMTVMNSITNGCFSRILLKAKEEPNGRDDPNAAVQKYRTEVMEGMGLYPDDPDYEQILNSIDTLSLSKQSKKVFKMVKKEQDEKLKKESKDKLAHLGDSRAQAASEHLKRLYKKVEEPKKTRKMVFKSLFKEGDLTYLTFLKRDEWTDRPVIKSNLAELLSKLHKDPSPFNVKRKNFFQTVLWYQDIEVVTYMISNVSFDWTDDRVPAAFEVKRTPAPQKEPYIHTATDEPVFDTFLQQTRKEIQDARKENGIIILDWTKTEADAGHTQNVLRFCSEPATVVNNERRKCPKCQSFVPLKAQAQLECGCFMCYDCYHVNGGMWLVNELHKGASMCINCRKPATLHPSPYVPISDVRNNWDRYSLSCTHVRPIPQQSHQPSGNIGQPSQVKTDPALIQKFKERINELD